MARTWWWEGGVALPFIGHREYGSTAAVSHAVRDLISILEQGELNWYDWCFGVTDNVTS